MSSLGTFILVAITATVTYFTVTSFGVGGQSGPLTLSPEVQRYVDAKLNGASSATAGQELPKLSARIAEMEKKLIEIEKTKASYDQLANKNELIESAIGEQRRRRDDAMAAARLSEMSQLRNDIATLCAGVTIKRVQGGSKGSSSEAQTFRNNIGAGGGGGARGGGAGAGDGGQMPNWLQNLKNRRGGGGGGARGGNTNPSAQPSAPAGTQPSAPATGGSPGGQSP